MEPASLILICVIAAQTGAYFLVTMHMHRFPYPEFYVFRCNSGSMQYVSAFVLIVSLCIVKL